MIVVLRFFGQFLPVKTFFGRNQEATILRISPKLFPVFIHASFLIFLLVIFV